MKKWIVLAFLALQSGGGLVREIALLVSTLLAGRASKVVRPFLNLVQVTSRPNLPLQCQPVNGRSAGHCRRQHEYDNGCFYIAEVEGRRLFRLPWGNAPRWARSHASFESPISISASPSHTQGWTTPSKEVWGNLRPISQPRRRSRSRML